MIQKTLRACAFVALFGTLAAAQRAATPAEVAQAQSDVPHLANVLELKPGMTVADVGAGLGAMTVVLAKWLGPSGRVFATDIAPEALAALRDAVASEHLENVIVVRGDAGAANLPVACCDAIFMRDVYHHIADPEAFDRSLFRALRAGGRLAIIDFDPRPGSPLPDGVPSDRGGHGITASIVARELTASGFDHVTTIASWPPGSRPGEYFLVLFRKP